MGSREILPMPDGCRPTKRYWGACSYYTPAELPAILEGLPEGSEVYTRPTEAAKPPSKIVWHRVNRRDRWTLYPLTEWEGVDPIEARREIMAAWPALDRWGGTPSSVARGILRLYLTDGAWPRQSADVQSALDGARWGPITRLWSTWAPEARMVDLSRAYARSMEAPEGLPVGVPRPWTRPLSRWRPGAMAWVEAEVIQLPPYTLSDEQGEYRGHLERWRGWLPELQDLVKMGFAEVKGDVSGLLWGSDHVLARVSADLRRHLSAPLAKLLYTRLWTCVSSAGGWVGVKSADPVGQILAADDERRPLLRWSPDWPAYLWSWDDPSPWGLRQPQIAAAVSSRVRGWTADVARRSDGLCQVYVDAVVAEVLPPDLGPEWREIAAGPWRAWRPGGYILGRRETGRGFRAPDRAELRSRLIHTAWDVMGTSSDGWPIAVRREE